MIRGKKKTIVLLSIGSDIGRHLAKHYLAQGHRVIGAYRNPTHVKDLKNAANCHLLACDLNRTQSIQRFVERIKNLRITWDIFVSCSGYPLPVMPFFTCDFDEWSASVSVNCIEQLRVLHGLYPHRNPNMAHVIFFAGGGMNNAVENFSAYTASKIFLAKMCEFLDMEEKRMNLFIVGPGWARTKIHQTILSDARTCQAKVKATKAFLKANKGTPLEDIAGCIDWLCQEGKAVASGRNFSITHDPWQGTTRAQLVRTLKADGSMYKLRRQGNNLFVSSRP